MSVHVLSPPSSSDPRPYLKRTFAALDITMGEWAVTNTPPSSPVKRFRAHGPAPSVWAASPPARGVAPTRKRQRDLAADTAAMVVDEEPAKRIRVDPNDLTSVPASVLFPYSKQRAWRDVVNALSTELGDSHWRQSLLHKFDQGGPDVPLITMRELQVLLARERERAEAQGRAQAERALEAHRLNLERQQQQYRQPQEPPRPQSDYRMSYIG